MTYELLYVIPATVTDAELPGLQSQVTDRVVAAGAEIVRNDHAGKLKLSYEVAGTRWGHYFSVYFTAEPTALAKIRESLRLSKDIARFQILGSATAPEAAVKLISHEEAKLRSREDRRPARGETRPDVAAPVAATDAPVNLEELDKKLDAILSE